MAKILVVDDEVQVRELVCDALGMKGHEVATVPSAEQALARISQEPFNLVLLDIKLDGESGISALKKIRALKSKIPVVIYSGVITAELEKEARTAGAYEVLNKNIGITQLVEQVGKIVKAKDRIFEDPSGKKEKSILIVDDESEVRRLLRDFFKKNGYRVLEAENGEKALELVRSESVSTVLLDIRMPGMDGIAVLEKLLEINPRISSSTSIRAAFGYNECKMAIEYYLENKKPEQPFIKQGRAVRYIEDYIFYENRNDC